MQYLKNNWKKIIVLAVIAGLAVIGYVNFSSNASSKKPITFTVKRQNLKDELSLSGHVDATEHIKLQFQTAGQISWIGVKEGDLVNKYQVIASLDQAVLKKQLQKYLNLYIKTRNGFDQNSDNNNNQIINDSLRRIANNYQQDLNNSVLDVELQDLTLKYANLWTPIEGVVTNIDSPVAGVNISSPTQATFEIVNPKTLNFSAVADQTDVVKLTEGMTGDLTLDAFPTTKIKATIKTIGFSPKTGETGTVYEIVANISDSSLLRFGMTGDLTFTLKEKDNVLSVPKNLIKEENGTKYVWVYKNNKGQKQTVTTGETIDNQTEIVSGLNENDAVGSQP